MENSNMLDELIEFCQQPILHELCLQEATFVDGTVEKPLETNVPEEIAAVFLCEEILGEVACEISKLI